MKAKFPTYEEMGKKVAEKALDEFLYDGKSIREWMQIIASEDCISRQATVEFLEKHAETYEDVRVKMGFKASASLINNRNYLPPVTPARNKGKWMGEKDYPYCSECGCEPMDFIAKLAEKCNDSVTPEEWMVYRKAIELIRSEFDEKID